MTFDFLNWLSCPSERSQQFRFRFPVGCPYGRDRQKDGRARRTMRPIRTAA